MKMNSAVKNTVKPRDPNWRDMEALRKSGAAGTHRDKKKEFKSGYQKHKGSNEMKEAYDHPQGAELSRMGRILMDKAVTTKDDALSNVMARVGDELTRYGAPGGASSIEELEKRTKLPKEKILKLMQWAKGQKDDSLSKVKDPAPSKDDMEEESVCPECGNPRFAAMPESLQQQYHSVTEEKQKGVDGKVCWKGYKRMGTKQKGGKTVDNCVKM